MQKDCSQVIIRFADKKISTCLMHNLQSAYSIVILKYTYTFFDLIVTLTAFVFHFICFIVLTFVVFFN